MKATKRGAKARLREFFVQNVATVLDSDTLREVAGTSEWARRIRELRQLEGMNIQTHNDNSSLKPGEYVLINLKLLPVFSSAISKETRALVLDRNRFTCQMCGVGAGEPHPHDSRPARLHIGHIIDQSHGGTNEAGNLRALCSVCNEGAANVTLARPTSRRLLVQIRRAPGSEQVEVLQWLSKKFPDEAKKFVEG
jgi:hypothetical protein